MKAIDDTPAPSTVHSMIQCPHCRRFLDIALTEAIE